MAMGRIFLSGELRGLPGRAGAPALLGGGVFGYAGRRFKYPKHLKYLQLAEFFNK